VITIFSHVRRENGREGVNSLKLTATKRGAYFEGRIRKTYKNMILIVIIPHLAQSYISSQIGAPETWTK
jgi:hypothetical protein